MSIKSGFEPFNTQKSKELTFPALYIWKRDDQYFGEVVLFTDETEGFVVISPRPRVGYIVPEEDCRVGDVCSDRVSCITNPNWRRLAIGERIYLENED